MHKLLAQQIAKATDEDGSLDLRQLSELVAAAYEDFDRDRRRTDRSMSLMIEELDAVQRNLEQTVIERTKELRAREAELQVQNTRFDAALSNMSQGLTMFDGEAKLRHLQSALHRHVPATSPTISGPAMPLRELIEAAERKTALSSGNPDHYHPTISQPRSKSDNRRASLSSWPTAAPSPWCGSRCRAAAGWRPTRTSPSGGRPR